MTLTSFFRPQSNGKIERYHRVLVDIMSKKLKDNLNTWDIHLNQTLAAIRFSVSEASKFSPFFLLFNRDVVLPLDNILKPRRKYTGEDLHQIALKQQHKAFFQVHQNLKASRRRHVKYANKNASLVKFEVGDPVYYKNFQRKSKLESKWKPYYRIIKQTSPVSYVIKNQLNGSTTKVHAEHIRLANVDEWQIPVDKTNRPLRSTQYVVPPVSDESSSSDTNDEESIPLAKLAKKYRKERDNSDNESDIPLMELKRRINERTNDDHYSSDNESDSDSYFSSRSTTPVSQSSDTYEASVTSDKADKVISVVADKTVNQAPVASDNTVNETSVIKHEVRPAVKKCKQQHPKITRREKMKNLLDALSGLL